MAILRYPKNHFVISHQDPFLDMLDWLGFLSAKDYLIDLLNKVHHLSLNEAQQRVQKIVPHIRIATDYIRQSIDGPVNISFLPAYYAILNLMKVYVLLGPGYNDLAKYTWHGATFDVHGKESQSLLTEEITLKKDGVFPLFYQTLTSKTLTNRDLIIKITDILPFITGVTYEYTLATGSPSLLCPYYLDYVKKENGVRPVITLGDPPGGKKILKNQLKVLRKFTDDSTTQNVFIGKYIDNSALKEEKTRSQLNTYLIYRMNPQIACTPICSNQLELPEEIPIALLFFYMSAVVRYRPEFFSRLRDSRYWPLLAAARMHSFHNFLLAFWSYMHKENYFINPAIRPALT